MIENELIIKITESLKEICIKEKLGLIERFTLIVNSKIEISKKDLLNWLIIELPKNVTTETEVCIRKMDLEVLSAVIYKVEGEKTIDLIENQ